MAISNSLAGHHDTKRDRSSWAFATISGMMAELSDLDDLLGSDPLESDVELLPEMNSMESSPERKMSQSYLDEETAQAIENICRFYEIFDGLGHEESEIHDAFERTFDTTATALTYPANTQNIKDWSSPHKRVEVDYNQLFFQDILPTSHFSTKIQITSIQKLVKGLVEYSAEFEYDGHLVKMRSLAYVENGKVVRLERQEAIFNEL